MLQGMIEATLLTVADGKAFTPAEGYKVEEVEDPPIRPPSRHYLRRSCDLSPVEFAQ